MNHSKEHFFEVEGVFYTPQDGTLQGYAYPDGDFWHIIPNDSEEGFNRHTVYLDRGWLIYAPRNIDQKKWLLNRLNDLISVYQAKVDELTLSVTLLKLDTFSMKLAMAESYLKEYKSLKYSYFSGNALKFILF